MGGGDLNLKKSWHPSTLRNIERVWKAEQKHETEQQKIEQLQKELAAERAREEIQSYAENTGVVKKRDQRLDWMYQGPAACVDRDEYLLGRKIDKTLELLERQESGKEPEKREEEQARSIFHPESTASDLTVDLANKIKEDPLFAIMKREKEERKTLLNNPIRMKQLQSLLMKSLSKSKKNKKSKKKKSKKSKKNETSSDSDSSDEEKQNINNKRKANNDSDDNSYKRQKIHKNISRDYHIDKYNYHSKEKQENHKHQSSSSDESNHYSKKKQHKSHTSEARNYKNSHQSLDTHNHKHRSPDVHKKRYHSPDEKSYKNHQSFDKRSHQNYQSEKLQKDHHRLPDYRSNKNHSERSDNYKKEINSTQKDDSKRKLSSAEKERLRQEMMENAKWREKQRTKNVKRYKEEAEKEEKSGKGSASDFIRPMLSKAAEQGTVEERVRQKIFTIQRKKSDMDSNFARR